MHELEITGKFSESDVSEEKIKNPGRARAAQILLISVLLADQAEHCIKETVNTALFSSGPW